MDCAKKCIGLNPLLKQRSSILSIKAWFSMTFLRLAFDCIYKKGVVTITIVYGGDKVA